MMDDEEIDPVPGPSGIGKKGKSNTTRTIIKAPKTEEKKPILELVCEAIETMGDKRKGASAAAIRKYVQTIKGDRPVNAFVKKALEKGIENGIISRSSKTEDKTGAVGWFLLVKNATKPKDTTKSAAKKTNEESELDDETADVPSKPKKRPVKETVEPSTSKPKDKKDKPAATSKQTDELSSQMKEPKNPKKRAKDNKVDDGEKMSKMVTKRTVEPSTSTPKDKKGKPAATSKEIVELTSRLKEPKKPKKRVKDNEVDDREEMSDTEIVVKKKGRKSIKSYSSDTELDFVESDRKAAEKSHPSSKKKTAKGTKKLYNPGKQAVKETVKKSGKTSKKEP